MNRNLSWSIRVVSWALIAVFIGIFAHSIYLTIVQWSLSEKYPHGMGPQEFYPYEWRIEHLIIGGALVGASIAVFFWYRDCQKTKQRRRRLG